MSNLESIVPPLELCKKIPEGEFRDSVLVWETYYSKHSIKPDVIDRKTSESASHEFVENVYPAPTLAEILNALYKQDRYENKLKICPVFPGGEWSIGYSYQKVEKDFDLTAAALRLWFKVKGIEVE